MLELRRAFVRSFARVDAMLCKFTDGRFAAGDSAKGAGGGDSDEGEAGDEMDPDHEVEAAEAYPFDGRA